MKPVTVSIDVDAPPADVFEYLDVMANHEQFMDHMLSDWRYSGPKRGIGSAVTVAVRAAGRTDQIEIVTIEGQPPSLIVERNVGAGGRRVATGTYRLAGLPGGGTRISFEYAWQRVPVSESLTAPLVRAVMRRGVKKGMSRLAARLRPTAGAGA